MERKNNGKFVTIPLARLSPGDRRFLLYGNEGGAEGLRVDVDAVELFPFSLGPWQYTNSVDLWSVLVNRTPLWLTLVLPLGIGALGLRFVFALQVPLKELPGSRSQLCDLLTDRPQCQESGESDANKTKRTVRAKPFHSKIARDELAEIYRNS